MNMRLYEMCTLLAAGENSVAEGSSTLGSLVQHLVAAVVFSAMGLLVFGAALWIANRFAPFSLRKELEEDQNTAVAIIIGASMIGVSIIIAAAIHG